MDSSEDSNYRLQRHTAVNKMGLEFQKWARAKYDNNGKILDLHRFCPPNVTESTMCHPNFCVS